MNRLVVTSAALAALAFAMPATPAGAQEKGVELGVGMLGWTNTSCSGCTSVSTIGTGGMYVASAFYLNSQLAIEPILTVSYVSGGGSHETDWGLGVGVPIYFSSTWGHKGWFVEPGATYRSLSCSGCTTEDQSSLDVALGYKAPIGKEAALRISALYDYGFKTSDIPQTNTFGLQFGLSVFLH